MTDPDYPFPVTVADLIAFLQQQDPTLLVVYQRFSEQCLLEIEEIEVQDLCEPRDDGWVHSARPDKPTQKYLCFPGN